MKEQYKLILNEWDHASDGLLSPIHDADLARVTKTPLFDLRNHLESMEQEGLIERVRVENPDGFKVLTTALGRIELSRLRLSQGRSRKNLIEPNEIKVVPKGLRSFDAEDKDFFLELLPGPRGNDGLPTSVRFWKTRIEERNPDKTFPVGLIYGPSGCGKSSLVKAGLLPRLCKHVLPIYMEATPQETEARLLRGLRRACPVLPPSLGLVESLAVLHGEDSILSGKKVLIVLDQFEQWLHGRGGLEDTELVNALRQCDGGRVQAIVIVLDDFWLATSRFMRDIGVRIDEGENSFLLDLFDPRHATKVLMAFGQAFGALPDNYSDLTAEQRAFLDEAVGRLAQDGKVISVRLALFAEMVKGKPWTPATLKEVGGMEGVGVTFLEETFSASSAPPSYRIYQKAAQEVLNALLSQSGSNIKGYIRSHRDLLEVSDYSSRPDEFDNLLRILDTEVRLITPTDSNGIADSEQDYISGERYYQLSHDFLVPSIREWLTRKRSETGRGRAELLLVERSFLWNAKPENRHLPSVWEWAKIWLMTERKEWSEPQRRMMKNSLLVYRSRALTMAIALILAGIAFVYLGSPAISVLVRALFVFAIMFSLVVAGVSLGSGYIKRFNESELLSKLLVEAIRVAETKETPQLIRQIASQSRSVNPLLYRVIENSQVDSKERLHASLALLPVDGGEVDYVYNRLLKADSVEFPVLRDALKQYRERLVERLWGVLEQPEDQGPYLQAASALALYDPVNPRWENVGGRVAQVMVTVNQVFLGGWLDALRPVRGSLTASLSKIFRDSEYSATQRSLATNILAEYVEETRPLLDLLMDSMKGQFAILFEKVKLHADAVVDLMKAEMSKILDEASDELEKDRLAERQARAAVALVRLGQADEVWPKLQHSPDPRLRTAIVTWLAPLGADVRSLASKLYLVDPQCEPMPGQGQRAMNDISFHFQLSMRRALILGLGQYGQGGLSPGEREPLIANLLDLYETALDAGTHGASEWTLRRWGQQSQLEKVVAKLRDKDRGNRRWYVNAQGQSFTVIDGPVEFHWGSPSDESDRIAEHETSHLCVIPRRFSIAAKEVTVVQYQRFMLSNSKFGLDPSVLKHYSPDPDGPMIGVTWFGAVAYCNWLSEQEGLPRDQWCYLPAEGGEYAEGMTIPKNALERSGYRLPTEAEWEYACRAGAETSRYYGHSEDLLGEYAWYSVNSRDHAWPCGMLMPNDLGLFDMLGNVEEWVQDRSDKRSRNEPEYDQHISTEVVKEKPPRHLRGGAFCNHPSVVQSGLRVMLLPSDRIFSVGFRLSRTLA